jgi:hypothetical protein
MFGLSKWENYREARALVVKKYKEYNAKKRKCVKWFVRIFFANTLRKARQNMEWVKKDNETSQREYHAACLIQNTSKSQFSVYSTSRVLRVHNQLR